MHIAQVIDALHWGGAEKWILSFSEVAKLRGLVVTVISLQPLTDDNPYVSNWNHWASRFLLFPYLPFMILQQCRLSCESFRQAL